MSLFLQLEQKKPEQQINYAAFIVVVFFVYALGNSASAMKTINMDNMQNIFLMKHFTQCTIIFLLTTRLNILYTFPNK